MTLERDKRLGRRPLSSGAPTTALERLAARADGRQPTAFSQTRALGPVGPPTNPIEALALRGRGPSSTGVAARGEHAMRTRSGPFRPGPGAASFGAAGMPIVHRPGVDFGGGRRVVVGARMEDAMPMRWNASQGWHHDAIGGGPGCSGEPGTIGSIAKFNMAKYAAERSGLVGGTEMSLVGAAVAIGGAKMTPAEVDDLALMMMNALRATGIVRSARPGGGTVAEKLVARQTTARSAADRLDALFSTTGRTKQGKSDLERILFLGPAAAAAAKNVRPYGATPLTPAQQAAFEASRNAMPFGGRPGGSVLAPPSSSPSGGGGADLSFDANVNVNLPKPPPPPSASASASFNVSGSRHGRHGRRRALGRVADPNRKPSM